MASVSQGVDRSARSPFSQEAWLNMRSEGAHSLLRASHRTIGGMILTWTSPMGFAGVSTRQQPSAPRTKSRAQAPCSVLNCLVRAWFDGGVLAHGGQRDRGLRGIDVPVDGRVSGRRPHSCGIGTGDTGRVCSVRRIGGAECRDYILHCLRSGRRPISLRILEWEPIGPARLLVG